MKKYFSMEKTEKEATINIYGDITSYPWTEGDVSAASLVHQLEALDDVEKINVYVNSYGGEVAEGLAIYNALRRHKAKVVTHCEGFACSIASVIFMAGDERIMSESSLLMIHNAWTIADGNAEQLRKCADDLEKITAASVTAYKAHSNLSEEEIKALMDAESWILPEEALEYGFATSIAKAKTKNASQNAKKGLLNIVKAYREKLEAMQKDDEKDDEGGGKTDETDDEKPPKTDDNGEEKPDTDEEQDENAENAAKSAPKSDETDEDGETGDEEENGEKNGKKAAEWLSGFFNAILKI